MKTLKHLFDQNLDWANKVKEKDPDFFLKLSKQQTPDYLWIGCSDSRVPANQIINLPPGEIFVHRNIANMVIHNDINCLSVIQFAVEVLKVKHIIVCGHYGCGGIKAAMDDQAQGLVGQWLQPIKDLYHLHDKDFKTLNQNERFNALCELHVKEQVKSVCNTAIIQNAWGNGAKLSIHGWVYDIRSGVLKDLDTCISSKEQLDQI